MKPYLLHREAERELEAAVVYYNEHSAGLGLEFLAEIERTLRIVQKFPHAWPLHAASGNRKAFLSRFPFNVYYLETADVIWIDAIVHAKRTQEHWRHRRARIK